MLLGEKISSCASALEMRARPFMELAAEEAPAILAEAMATLSSGWADLVLSSFWIVSITDMSEPSDKTGNEVR
ncbi:MAG: hypothetical protein I8H71_09040 [Xanthomonadaceae bacterium]|nr:hypothetical protein [Xanthomonadaceae bacterium]